MPVGDLVGLETAAPRCRRSLLSWSMLAHMRTSGGLLLSLTKAALAARLRAASSLLLPDASQGAGAVARESVAWMVAVSFPVASMAPFAMWDS